MPGGPCLPSLPYSVRILGRYSHVSFLLIKNNTPVSILRLLFNLMFGPELISSLLHISVDRNIVSVLPFKTRHPQAFCILVRPLFRSNSHENHNLSKFSSKTCSISRRAAPSGAILRHHGPTRSKPQQCRLQRPRHLLYLRLSIEESQRSILPFTEDTIGRK